MILLLPGTDTAGAAHVLERVQAGLKGTQLPGLPADVRVTVSVGIAEFPTDAPTPDALVQRADARLLQAKRSGRDRIVTADSGAGIRLVS